MRIDLTADVDAHAVAERLPDYVIFGERRRRMNRRGAARTEPHERDFDYVARELRVAFERRDRMHFDILLTRLRPYAASASYADAIGRSRLHQRAA